MKEMVKVGHICNELPRCTLPGVLAVDVINRSR